MSFDIAIIGAGMAGASLAAELSTKLRVLLLEQEAQPGYHSTGRSAAFWDECYGGMVVQPLTSASGAFLRNPPKAFSDKGFLRPRGVVYLAQEEDRADCAAFQSSFARAGVRLECLERDALLSVIPALAPRFRIGIRGPDCCDIDVAGLHAAYLRQARRNGVTVACHARVSGINHAAGGWQLKTANDVFEAKQIVNAAGAWADKVSHLAGAAAIGHQPFRRTIAQVRTSPAVPADMPLVIDFQGNFYFKPEQGGRLGLAPMTKRHRCPVTRLPTCLMSRWPLSGSAWLWTGMWRLSNTNGLVCVLSAQTEFRFLVMICKSRTSFGVLARAASEFKRLQPPPNYARRSLRADPSTSA